MGGDITKNTKVSLPIVITIVLATITIVTSWDYITNRLSVVEGKVDKIITHLEIEDKIVKD